MLCLAFFDKVNCKQITNIVWPLSSRRTVNKSLTKPDVTASQGACFFSNRSVKQREDILTNKPAANINIHRILDGNLY